jgi:nucleoside-diphosphate-sugar epimerase
MPKKALVLGSDGLVGAAVVARLKAEGHEIVPFDISGNHDVLDADDVTNAAKGCTAIVNAAGGHRPTATDPGTRFITANVTGNYNVLDAARTHGIDRVVTFSSVNALGCFRGEAPPAYFPIDDDHPIRPPTAYGQAKRLIEELCRCFTETTGISTVVFRPPAILGPARWAKYAALREADPAAEWTPFWEYGAWIDTRDVAGAVLAALNHPNEGHLTGLIVADDSTSPIPATDLAARLHPETPWRAPKPTDPTAPLVTCERIKTALNWAPQYRWSDKCGL